MGNDVPIQFADRLAVYSLILASATPLLAYLFVLAGLHLADHFHEENRSLPHFIEDWWTRGYITGGIFWLAVALETTGLGLGIFSLFRKRSRLASLWLGLLGILSSGLVLGVLGYFFFVVRTRQG